jgi:hypothetical protein
MTTKHDRTGWHDPGRDPGQQRLVLTALHLSQRADRVCAVGNPVGIGLVESLAH